MRRLSVRFARCVLAIAALAIAAAPAHAAPAAAIASTPPIIAAPVDSAKAAWAEARALADRAHYDEALGVVRTALKDAPDNTDLRWLEAAIRGWQGDHAGAVRLYERLVAEHPELTTDVRDDLATERLWAGDVRGAQRDFARYLAAHPDDATAALGLARIDNWQGRHRRAIARLGPLANDPDADPEVMKTLAFAHYWDGDPGPARLALDAYLARAPHDREALDLRARLARELSLGLTLGHARSDDTDGLRIETNSLELRWPVGVRDVVTLAAQRDNVRDPGGTRDPRQLGGGIETLWSPAWTTHASARAVDLGTGQGTPGMFELAAVWRPDDRVRVDVGTSRDLVMTRASLALGISAQTWVGGVDWTPVERWMLHADARQRFYSDDNRAQVEAASVRWQAYANRLGRVAALVEATQLRTRRDLDDGYYDPAQYVEWGPGLDAEWTPRADVEVTGSGRTGWQHERNAESRPFVNVAGRIEWTLGRALLALEGGRSNSNLESASGYERQRWAVSAGWGF